MIGLVPATWEDLGYRRLGPVIPGDAQGKSLARSVAASLEKAVGFEWMEDAGEIWIRERARRKGRHAPQCMEIVAASSADAADNIDFGFIDRLARSRYATGHEFALDDSQRRQKVTSFAAAPESAHAAYELSLSFASVPYAELKNIIGAYLLPAFFGAYSTGRVIFVTTDYQFESRNAGLRGGYAVAQLGDPNSAGLAASGFDALAPGSL